MEKFKIRIFRLLMKFFWIFPIQKQKLFFSSYEGKQFSCNPKALFQFIQSKKQNELKYVYEFNSNEIPDELKRNCVVVKHNSFAYLYHIMTCKYLITNSGISCCFPLRKAQINIDTWHGGGAYKKVGFAASKEVHGGDLYGVYIGSKQTTYFLSSSKMFTDIMADSLKMEKSKFLEVGMPRNDVFFNPNKMRQVNETTRKSLNIEEDEFVVLYAPTYRGSAGSDNFVGLEFDVEKMLEVLKQKYNKKIRFLVRMHYFNNTLSKKVNEAVMNVSSYPDMQELLVSADMLITDYSSSIWDYSFTNRPCHLFAMDVHEFIKDRGFYTDIHTWPGILSSTPQELYDNILKFKDEEYKIRVAKHQHNLGNGETGNACNLLYKTLFK